jgi:hypothetical protein
VRALDADPSLMRLLLRLLGALGTRCLGCSRLKVISSSRLLPLL